MAGGLRINEGKTKEIRITNANKVDITNQQPTNRTATTVPNLGSIVSENSGIKVVSQRIKKATATIAQHTYLEIA